MGFLDMFKPKNKERSAPPLAGPRATNTTSTSLPRATAPAAGAIASAPNRTYTVKTGDTLSLIAKRELGDASQYMVLFEANRNILNDPDKILPGQVLKIPQNGKQVLH